MNAFAANGRLCPLCGSRELETVGPNASDARDEKKEIGVVECGACGLAWQWPSSRSASESISFFEASYADNARDADDYFHSGRKSEISHLQMDYISELFEEPGELLDLGSGAGIFAREAARRGWRGMGVDPSYVKPRERPVDSKIEFLRGAIDDLPSGGRFDLITMWDVIEHTERPKELLAKTKDLLKKGGYLVIETGNYLSADRVYGGRDHWIYQMDHRWYFSPATLEELLRQAGFNDFHYTERVFRPGWEGRMEYEGPSLLRHMGALIRRPWRARRTLDRYFVLRKAAEQWPKSGLSIFTLAARGQ